MNIIKVVPTGPALRAAVDVTDHTHAPDVDGGTFPGWFNKTRVAHDLLVMAYEVTLEEALSLAEDCPKDPAGVAWATELRRCVELTRADAIRPFDRIDGTVDGVQALDAFVASLRAASPLLSPVANALAEQGNVSGYLGDVAQRRAAVTAAGIWVEDPDRDPDDVSYLDVDPDTVTGPVAPDGFETRHFVPWTHVDVVRALDATGTPGNVVDTSTEVARLLDTIWGQVPQVADDDHGRARGVLPGN